MAAITRLAPSPTGALHLGNARTFLVNWLLARQNGWQVMLRIEDLDGPRTKSGADLQAMSDLQWLGIDWDAGPVYQSQRHGVYAAAAQRLLLDGFAYYCTCTRKDVATASSAPHSDDGAAVYPGTCRDRWPTAAAAMAATGKPPVTRLKLGDAPVEFTDCFAGRQRFEPAQQLGDFVILKADGSAAYQLASVIDDVGAGVTHVVRGDDLLDSVPRQLALYDALRLTPCIEAYYHLPLIKGPDQRRLAKRHGDTRLATYRSARVTPGRVRALLARWCGMGVNDEITIEEMLSTFNLDKVSREPITFTDADERWLRGGRR